MSEIRSIDELHNQYVDIAAGNTRLFSESMDHIKNCHR